ncbi:hypothetical protein BH24ACT22_BH24ACT22_07160 [soil metagenome]
MLTKPQVSTTLEARCPGCSHEYPGASLPFLYADELGHRCPGCGSVLIIGHDGGAHGKVREPYSLVLSGHLEGSGLHEKLAGLVGDDKELELAVDRTGEARTVRLAFSVSGTGFAPGGETR